MFYALSGKLAQVSRGFAVLDVQGVGYKLSISLSTAADLPPVGSPASLFTHLAVREDALELYGFSTERELRLFELLTSVSGVGPRSALGLLSLAPSDLLAAAIGGGDVALLTKSIGIGKKTAERIVLELKTKLTDFARPIHEKDGDVFDALVGLGYARSQVREAMQKLDAELTTPEERLKAALRLVRQTRSS